MPATLTTIRGVLLNEMFTILKATQSEKFFAHALASIPTEMRAKYEQKLILNTAWYDVSTANTLAKPSLLTTGSSLDFAHDLGAKCIDNLMRSVHRVLLGLLTPDMMVSQAERLFHTYYRGGVLRIEKKEQGVANLLCQGYSGMSPDLWLAVCGGMESAMRLCGEKNIRLRPLPQKAASETVLEVRWGSREAAKKV